MARRGRDSRPPTTWPSAARTAGVHTLSRFPWEDSILAARPFRETDGTIRVMTYYSGKELAAAFRTVRNNTIKIAEEIPEDKYSFQAASDSRTVAQTLVHIATEHAFSDAGAWRAEAQDHGRLQFLQLHPPHHCRGTEVAQQGGNHSASADQRRSVRQIAGGTVGRFPERVRELSRRRRSRHPRLASRCCWVRRSMRCIIAPSSWFSSACWVSCLI